MMEQEREYLHSWYVLIITFFTLLFLLISRNTVVDLLLMSFVFYVYLKNGLHFSRMRKIFVFAFLFSFGIFLLNVLYPSKALKIGETYQLGHLIFYKASVDKALITLTRLFFVSVVSMCSGFAIDYTKVVMHLIVHKGLRLFWGYPVLLALNSIALFKQEFDRIKINARFRDLPLKDKIFIFFPLLVFAIRHSQRGALSLVTRGLNEQKSFYFSYDLSVTDKRRLFLFWLIYFGLVSLSLLKLR